MAEKLACLQFEPDLNHQQKPLPYSAMLKELACEALQSHPLYVYRGKTAEEVRQRITEVKRIVRRCLHLAPGAIPGKPTRVVTQKAIHYDGFSIQPVAIERGSGWWITAHLYLPDGLTQPAPAVMHVHGHSYLGKSTDFYARRCRGLARRGFVVLFVDFPEADERKGTGHALWYPTMANLPIQRIMVEDNSAALTYLSSLPFVDEKRIGVTGSSGGGNQTVFFSVVDDRIAAAAPTNAPCLITEHAASGSGAYCHCEAIQLRALPKRPAGFLSISALYQRELCAKRGKKSSKTQLNKLLGRNPTDSEARGLAAQVTGAWARVVLAMGDGSVVPLAIRGTGLGKVTVIIADGGKTEALKQVAEMRGRIALFDWRGQGETSPPHDEWQQRAAHYLSFSGRSLPGGRVTDLIGVIRWLRRQGYEVDKVLSFGGEASLLTLLAASIEENFPKIILNGLIRTLKDAPGMAGQVRYTAWVPGLALETDIPQLLKTLGDRVKVSRWLTPGEEKPREGFT